MTMTTQRLLKLQPAAVQAAAETRAAAREEIPAAAQVVIPAEIRAATAEITAAAQMNPVQAV